MEYPKVQHNKLIYQAPMVYDDSCIYDVNIDLYTIITYEEAKKRAEAYLIWRGAEYNYVTNLWDFNGDITCTPETFLVYNGVLIVNFGQVTGTFTCYNMGLVTLAGTPTSCNEFYVSNNYIINICELPLANRYDLSYNSIETISNGLFSIGSDYINISNNNLSVLPDMKNLYLSEFNCSFNKLNTLQNAPPALIFYANSNIINKITYDDILFERVINYLDISNNIIIDLVGIPPVKQLNCINNLMLKSAKGLETTYEKFRTLDIFKDIDLSSTGLTTLDYLPEEAYNINVDYTDIKNLESNTLRLVTNLSVRNCKNLKDGSKNLNVQSLHINTKHKLKTFKNIANNVDEIICDNPTANTYIRNEISFFNDMKPKVKNYHMSFLTYLYDNIHIVKENPKYTIDNYYWPEGFEETIHNSAKSLKTVSKFNL